MATSPNAKDEKPWQFKKGNKGGPGNPHAAAAEKFRAMLYKSCDEEHLKKVVAALFRAAEQGQSWAVQMVMDRLLGKVKDVQDLNLSGTPTLVLHMDKWEPSGE